MWRPLNWRNKYSEEWYREYLPFAKRGLEPCEIEWSMEDCEIAFESGADAILEAWCTPENYLTDQWDSKSLKHLKGWMVFIPDEEEE
jgi:hypothetical protein